jgi:xylan 1,4-beta-xylosidase
MNNIKCLLWLVLLTLANSVSAQQLVMPGDHPDPSVVKIGDTYWASATTSNWFPAYPLMQSKDLVKWNTVGYVFNQMPAWADYYFWAPEISYENGKVYVYYAAHKKNGNLCVGVASADRPEGPYRDHGPLMCQEAGSIDAFPMRDENGKLYLVWKEDANSVGKPTSIWAMQMNEERTALIGEKKELFRNDKQWEGNLVEGVSMIRKGDYFYAFYAASACCGRACTYGTGIARSKNLLGPWEKYQNNPVSIAENHWKCPGHGTPIEKDGKYYFLYHAYDAGSTVFAGRQGLLSEFSFTNDGWIQFMKQQNTSATLAAIIDEFKGSRLSTLWQWSVFQPVKHQVKDGCLLLTSLDSFPMTFMGQKTYNRNYQSFAVIDTRKTSGNAGIAAIGDEKNIVSAVFSKGVLRVIMLRDGKENIIVEKAIPKSNRVYLMMEVQNGKDINFRYSLKSPVKSYQALNGKPVDGDYLPPWDRAVRAGVVVSGKGLGAFESFTLRTNNAN